MKALGFFAGIGAMLIPAKEQGFEIIGNVETRTVHCFRDSKGLNTYEENFKTPISSSIFDIDYEGEVDLLCAQPKCGGFSKLFGTGRAPNSINTAVSKYGLDIVETLEAVAHFKPRFFVLENLAKSLTVVGPEVYAELLPEYDIYPEWVSNYNYGNVQKGRNRLFMICALKTEKFAFIPGEQPLNRTVKDALGDIVDAHGILDNHDPHTEGGHDNITNLAKDTTWKSIAEYVLTLPLGKNLPYRAKDGDVKFRIGSGSLHWEKHSHALAGIKGAKFHPLTGYPISIRERCRIQGYPDDFIIHGTKLEEDGTWELKKNQNVVRQLNNTVPYEFCNYVTKQIVAHIKGEKFKSSGLRLLKPDDNITTAKKWLMENHGYSDTQGMLNHNWFDEPEET